MKNRTLNILSFAFLMTSVMMFSCDEKDDAKPVAPATQASSKDKLREEGIAAVNSMEKMKNNDAIEALAVLSSLLNNDDAAVPTPSPSIAAKISTSIVAGVNNNADFSELDLISEEDEPESLEELWAEAKGTHTYNPQKEDFDFVKGGDEVVVLFPSEEDGTTNNVKLTVSDFKSVPAKTDVLEKDLEYSGDLPTSAKASLSIDGTEALSYSFSAAYDAEDRPTSVSTSLVLSPFSINASFAHTGTQISYSTSLKEGEKIILGSSISVSGNISYDQLVDLEDEDDFNALKLKGLSYSLQIQNTKLVATVADVNKAVQELADSVEILKDDDALGAIEKILNDNVKIDATFADTNQKIADVSIDLYEPQNDDDEGFDIILTYADGTKVAIDEFIDDSFSGLEEDIEKLIEDIEKDFE